MEETISIVDKLSVMPGVILSMRVDGGFLYLTMQSSEYLLRPRKVITGTNRHYNLATVEEVGLDKIIDEMYYELEGM